MILKPNEILMFDGGAYSDYQVYALCRVTKKINTDSLLAEYLEAYPKQIKQYRFNESQFIKWLEVDKNCITTIKYRNWYLSGYSDSEEIKCE